MIDLSLRLGPHMPTYKGLAAPVLTFSRRQDRGDPATESALALPSHSGTHVDAPAHFLPDGDTIDLLPADRWSGRAAVVDLAHLDRPVEARDLSRQVPPGTEVLLLKTAASQAIAVEGRWRDGLPVLSLGAARALVQLALKAVGVDNLSVEAGDPEHRVHRALLRGGVGIIEGLDLSEAPPGVGFLFCLPLRIVGAEAAPARAILLPEGP
jgi:arylformamidase